MLGLMETPDHHSKIAVDMCTDSSLCHPMGARGDITKAPQRDKGRTRGGARNVTRSREGEKGGTEAMLGGGGEGGGGGLGVLGGVAGPPP